MGAITAADGPRPGPGEALYLFCFAWAQRLPPPAGLGVDGRHPLFLWSYENLAAILGVVALKEFAGPEAEARMQELAWLKPRLCRHHGVIAQAMRHSPVLPVGFGTLFSSGEALAQLVAGRHRQIASFLQQVADHEEWAVKGLLDKVAAKERLRSQTLAGEEERLASLAPGRRYLQVKRLQAGADRELSLRLKRVGGQLARELMRAAKDFRERPLLPRDITGLEQELVLNWAFLVPRGSAAEFQARLKRANHHYAKLGLIFVSSGPWPPYSFTPSLLPQGSPGEAARQVATINQPNLPPPDGSGLG
jgi:hypothetical protein